MRSTVFENKTTMAEALGEMPCRTDQTAAEAATYAKQALPGQRKNPSMETHHSDRPRRGHGY
jgi:hypothetical protein